MSPQNRPRTFGDLYTEIQEKSVLTPEQEDVLRDRAIERYGITGLRAKQQEILTTDTRRELSVLLSGLPEHDQILTKLDPLLPGGEIPKKVMLQEIQSKTPDPSGEESPVADAAPAIATAVVGVGAAIVGTGLISEKGWKKTLAKGFHDFKDWIGSLFDEESMFGSLLGGFKEKIMGIFSVIGAKLGIKPKEGSKEKSDASLDYMSRGEHGSKGIFATLVANKKASADLQDFFTNSKLLSLTKKQISDSIKNFQGNTKGLAKELGFAEQDGEKVMQTLKLYESPDCMKLLEGLQSEDAQDKPIAFVFAHVGKYVQFIAKIREKGAAIDLREVSFGAGSFPDTGDMKEFIGDKKEMLADLHSRFKGFTPNVLKILSTHYSEKSYKGNDYSQYKDNLSEGKDGEWEFVTQKLPEYAKSLPALLRNCAFGDPETEKLIEKHIPGMKHEDLVSFFILSGGHTDFSKMNSWEKSQVTMRLALFIRHQDKIEGYSYIFKLAGKAFSGEPMKMPSEVKMIINEGVGLLMKGAKSVIEEGGAILMAIAKEHPWLAGAGAGTLVGVVALAMRLTVIGRVVSTVAWLLRILVLSGLALGAYAIAGNDILKDGKKVGEVEELAKSIEKQGKGLPTK